jgi:hypothetical protein
MDTNEKSVRVQLRKAEMEASHKDLQVRLSKSERDQQCKSEWEEQSAPAWFLASSYVFCVMWILQVGGWYIFFAVIVTFVCAASVLGSIYSRKFDGSSIEKPNLDARIEKVAMPVAIEKVAIPVAKEASNVVFLDQSRRDDLFASLAVATNLADDEATILALFRFRQQVESLVGSALDSDFASEVDTLATMHTPELLEDYSKLRKGVVGPTGKLADQTLCETILRLTTRLKELAKAQEDRNMGELEVQGNFLRARHPVASDDPFKDT